MADDDTITVTIGQPAVEQAEGTQQETRVEVSSSKTEKAETTQDLAEQYKALQAENEKTTQRAAQAEAEAARQHQAAQAARGEAQSARSEASARSLETIEASIKQAQTEAAAAEQAYSVAYDNGDKAGIVKAQREMARAEAKLLRFDEAKADLEVQRTQSERQGQQQDHGREQQRTAPADPVEALISNHSPDSAAWLRSHPNYAKSLALSQTGAATLEQRRMASKLAAADNDAVAEGYDRDTPQYFQHVEKFLGLRNDGSNGQTNGANNGANGNGQAKRRQSVPAAPVTQSGGGASGNSGTEVRLTKGEAAAATDGTHVWNYDDPTGNKKFKKGDPIGVQEFARRKLALKDSGAYDRAYVEQ